MTAMAVRMVVVIHVPEVGPNCSAGRVCQSLSQSVSGLNQTSPGAHPSRALIPPLSTWQAMAKHLTENLKFSNTTELKITNETTEHKTGNRLKN